MKKDIHPQLNMETTVSCVCGNSFVTISTKKDIKVEICSKCHPFFTGTQKLIDTEGRIDKFAKKLKLTQHIKDNTKASVKKEQRAPEKKETLKEVLEKAKQKQD